MKLDCRKKKQTLGTKSVRIAFDWCCMGFFVAYVDRRRVRLRSVTSFGATQVNRTTFIPRSFHANNNSGGVQSTAVFDMTVVVSGRKTRLFRTFHYYQYVTRLLLAGRERAFSKSRLRDARKSRNDRRDRLFQATRK